MRRRSLTAALLLASWLPSATVRAEGPTSAPPPPPPSSATTSSPNAAGSTKDTKDATGSPAGAAPEEPTRSPDEAPALVIGGIAFAALVTGTVYGVVAWQEHENFLGNPNSDTASRGQFDAFMADMCFAGGASLAIVSAILFMRPEPEAPPDGPPPPGVTIPRVSLSTFGSGHGAGAMAVIRW